MPIVDDSKLRQRAIAVARAAEYTADCVSAFVLETYTEDTVSGELHKEVMTLDVVRFRIGIDNMLAAMFELGYRAGQDDMHPVRALGGASESRRTRAARAVKRRK